MMLPLLKLPKKYGDQLLQDAEIEKLLTRLIY